MKKLFAIFLVLCLLVSVVPVAAVETVTTEAQPQVESQPVSVESADPAAAATSAAPVTSSEVTVVREEESLRGEYEKHFLMSDGSYQAVVYSYPVHELVNGVWVELPIPEQTARGEVSPGNAQQNIIDNYVWQNHGVQDNNSVRLYIGKRSGNECRAFIRFATMPTIPAGATITAATMRVNMVSGTSTAYNAKASQVTGTWESGTIQWSNMPTVGAVLENNISHNNKTKYEFSCLTAVQHWYANSTTGQNENYGIMLQYADSSIADYNSFYSADCTDATSRPSMTISYDPAVITADEISVQEGYLAQLPLPNISGTITWTSANENVATVNSNGVVTGIKAGKVTVTASVEDVVTYTYTVYVKIKEGPRRVYCANSNYYLSVGGGMLEDAGLWIKNTSNEGLPLYRQVWKIYYLAQGYYVIRPLHNQNMALCAKDGVCSVTTIGSSNYLIQVPEENRWTIEWVNGGYVFKCQGDSSQTLRSLYNAPDVRVYTGEYMSSNNVFQWNFSDSTDIQPEVLLLNSKTGEIAPNIFRGILPKQSTTLADLDLTATFVCTAKYLQDPTWYSSATSSISVNATTGVIKGDTVGNMATITVKYGNNGSYYTRAIYLVVVPFTEGSFYIKSSADEKYLQVANGDSENYDCTSGAEMVQWHFTGESNQRWIFTLQNDGYFSIISAKSGLALSVPFAQSAEVDVTLRQLPYEGNSCQKWRIVETAAHGYKIVPQSALIQSKDLAIALAATVITIGDGIQIQQREYVSDGDLRDEWIICSYDNAILLAIDDVDGSQRHSYFSNTKRYLETERNGVISLVSTSRYSTCTKEDMINYLQSNSIFIIHTHGSKYNFKIGPSSYLSYWDIAGKDLSNIKFALLLTCYTGKDFNKANIDNGTPQNIVEQMVVCGAESVIGFEDETKVSDCNQFAPDLTQKIIVEGYPAGEAYMRIDYSDYIFDMSELVVLAGNSENTLS